jgi:2-oxo-4-hydroxy-4-carboxy-5-ureidoimidazoline decarboxylase
MHPELAGQEAQEGKLTDSSASEQSRLGFHMLSEAELSHMTALNRRYLDRFGFPCIIALQRHKTRKSVIAELEHRLGNDRDDEIDAGLQQIGIITRGRLQALGLPADVAQGCAPAGLTTHVLDAVHGAGAAGVRIELGRFEGVTLRPLKIVHTRANGRAELLEASEMDAGEYQLAFAVADYFRRRGTALADPPFLDEVVIRFVVAEPIRHCHVPVIASPWTYSTYRGGLPPKGE